MERAQFVTDLEGPLTLNDNAFEIAAHFLPNGAHFFALISKYDDILADLLRREGYQAGNTVKLILPFVLAFGLRSRDVIDFSRKNIKLVPDARQAIRRIFTQMPAFIISTSYEPYVQAVCAVLNFPCENAYCTKVSWDSYELSERERRELQALYAQIVARPPLEIPLSERDRETVALFDTIFWEQLVQMKAGRILHEVQPVGGVEKARALRDSLQRTGVPLSRTIYVGDSITDVEALGLVRRAGGLAVAFNGNRYALEAAQLGCISPNALILAKIAEAFERGGHKTVGALKNADLTDTVDEAFIQRSEQIRRRLRGEVIGGLG